MNLNPQVAVEEYLATAFEFPTEYWNGELIRKSGSTWFHAQIQAWLGALLLRYQTAFAIGHSLTCRISDSEFRLPDIAVAPIAAAMQDTIQSAPLFLAIEILSFDDSLGQTFAKLERYHAWGTPYCWLIDPERRTCWTYHRFATPIQTQGTITAGEIELSVAEIFSILPPA